MKTLLFLSIIPLFCFGSESTIFKSSCSGVEYKIESFCKANNLQDDQDKLDMPICTNQVLSIRSREHNLSKDSGFVERITKDGKKTKMMNFVFYGASCKGSHVILSASGGCNACGETFKVYNVSGQEVKDKLGDIDLNPMQDIIPQSFIIE